MSPEIVQAAHGVSATIGAAVGAYLANRTAVAKLRAQLAELVRAELAPLVARVRRLEAAVGLVVPEQQIPPARATAGTSTKAG